MRHAVPIVLLLAACSKPAPSAEAKLGRPAMRGADVAAEARKLQLEPGQWETTTTITALNVPGLPAAMAKAATGTPTTTSACITPAEAARPSADILAGAQGGNCTYQRFSMANAQIDAAMTCAPPGAPSAVALTLNGGYSPQTFDMGMVVKTDLPGQGAMTQGTMTMRARVSGLRTGACIPNPQETTL